jgi:DNA modification methylase
LREYNVSPTVWGGDRGCEHDWQEQRYYTEQTRAKVTSEAFSEAGEANVARLKEGRWRNDATCSKCGAWLGCLGAERHPDEFVAHLVAVLREVKRVLRDDGLVFVNIGDTMIGYHGNSRVPDDKAPSNKPGYVENMRQSSAGKGIPNKSLALIPERLALALQADGWIVRSRIVWAKGISFCPTYAGSVMPSSDPSKPTPAHETVLMLAKGQRYWSDWYAVREKFADDRQGNPGAYKWSYRQNEDGSGIRGSGGHGSDLQTGKGWNRGAELGGRNVRNVWAIPGLPPLRDDLTDEQLALLEGCFEPQGEDGWLKDVWAVNPKGSDEPHYAMFPEALVRPMIRAGCPAVTCGVCGAPHVRQVEKGAVPDGSSRGTQAYAGQQRQHDSRGGMPVRPVADLGFAPTCACGPAAGTRPGLVLDPFVGAGTTLRVALQEGRRALGIELNPRYAEIARRRASSTTPTLFTDDSSIQAPDVDAQGSLFEDGP